MSKPAGAAFPTLWLLLHVYVPPMLATVITGTFAGGRSTSSSNRDLHLGLGSLTAGMYFIAAYFAIAAPRIKGTETRGPIRLHKALAWIHGPGMILTPILGAEFATTRRCSLLVPSTRFLVLEMMNHPVY